MGTTLILDAAAEQTVLSMTRAVAIDGQVHAIVHSAPASGGEGGWYVYRRHSAGHWQIIGPVHSAGEAAEAFRQDAITHAHPEVAAWAEKQSSLLLAPARTAWPGHDLTPGRPARDPVPSAGDGDQR
jgi:hypothetical protein